VSNTLCRCIPMVLIPVVQRWAFVKCHNGRGCGGGRSGPTACPMASMRAEGRKRDTECASVASPIVLVQIACQVYHTLRRGVGVLKSVPCQRYIPRLTSVPVPVQCCALLTHGLHAFSRILKLLTITYSSSASLKNSSKSSSPISPRLRSRTQPSAPQFSTATRLTCFGNMSAWSISGHFTRTMKIPGLLQGNAGGLRRRMSTMIPQ
jgi:hypothetical protein